MDVEFEMDPEPHEVATKLRDLADNVDREQEDAAEEIALRVLADARRKVNVDTGRLRSSIDYEIEVQGQVVTIRVGSNVVYAIWQELDSPYLRPAWSEQEDSIERILIEMIERAANEADLDV